MNRVWWENKARREEGRKDRSEGGMERNMKNERRGRKGG